MNTHVGEIYIIYSKEDKSNINNIKKIIENNYDLISDYLDNRKVINLNKIDFDTFFNSAINDTFKDKILIDMYTKREFIPFLYTEYIIRKNNYYAELALEKKSVLSDEMIFDLISYKYYEENGTYEEFLEYLKYKNNKEEINNWIKKNYIYDTYEYLLNQITDVVYKNNDIDDLIQEWFNKYSNNNKVIVNEEENKSIEDFDSLFNGFLEYIKAPSEWLNIYNNLKDNKLIIDKELKGKEFLSKCYLDEDDDEFKILIYNRNTYKGFFVFVHEFIHYVTKHKCDKCKNEMISEFPSMYYEKEVKDYLELNGYKVDNLLNIREKDNLFVYNVVYPIYDLIKEKEKYTEEEYEYIIDNIIRNYYMILKGFGYLISSYLANKVYELNDEEIKDKMTYVSDNINKLDINVIEDLFNLKNNKELKRMK